MGTRESVITDVRIPRGQPAAPPQITVKKWAVYPDTERGGGQLLSKSHACKDM